MGKSRLILSQWVQKIQPTNGPKEVRRQTDFAAQHQLNLPQIIPASTKVRAPSDRLRAGGQKASEPLRDLCQETPRLQGVTSEESPCLVRKLFRSQVGLHGLQVHL